MVTHAGLYRFGTHSPESGGVESVLSELAEFATGTALMRTREGVTVVSRVQPRRVDAPEQHAHECPNGHIIAWDGRLDNRSDLDCQLPTPLPLAERTDAQLALSVYKRWGVQGLEKLLGDWSLAIYDPLERCVVLASDFAGNRGLYFTVDTRQLLWSTSLGVLVKVTKRSDPSQEFIAGYLTASVPPGATPYKQISVVKPGHAAVIKADGRVNELRFCDISIGRIQYADRRDYAAALQELVSASIQARLRGNGIWVELSGGLDSSTIVCVADRLSRMKGHCRTLDTISFLATDSPDERVFIDSVATQCDMRIRTHYLRIEDCYGVADSERCWITPRHPSNALLCEYRLVLREGGRAILSGHAGDILFGNTTDNPAAVLEPLTQGHPWAAVLAAREWAKAARKTIWEIAGDASICLGSDTRLLRHYLHRALHDQGPLTSRNFLTAAAERFFLSPSSAAHWREELERRAKRVRAFGAPEKHLILSSLCSLLDDRSFQSPSELPTVHVTYPYLHRPLVTYALSIPPAVLCQPDAPRALMRDAFRPVLPELVARRFSKGRLSEPGRKRLVRDFAARCKGRVHDLRLVQGGFIHAAALDAELTCIQSSGVRRLRNFPELLRLERWLAALDQSQASEAAFGRPMPA